jgi:hypothetical protein
MVQPFDYTLKTPSPTESFLAGVQTYQQQQQMNAQMARAQAEQAEVDRKIAEKLRQVEIFQKRLGPGATAADRDQAIRELGPDSVNAVQSMWKGMDEGRRAAYLEAGRSVYNDLMPLPDGSVDIERAIANLNKRADAAKNIGDTVLSEQLTGLSDALQKQPGSARALQGVIDLQVRSVDPDAADKMTGFGDAAAQMRAANINPYSEQGSKLFENIVFKQGQILVQGAPTPGGGTYTGTLQNYLELYGTPVAGAAAGAPSAKPRVFSNVSAIPADLKAGDIVNGMEYIGGPVTGNPGSWRKPQGGGASNGTGSFQGQ